MDRRQRKINRILDTLREGTAEVRRNPSGSNYRRWEGKITQAGRDTSPILIIMLGTGFLCIGIILVYQIASTSRKDKLSTSYSGCYLHNDNSNYSTVNIRSNCDVRACGYDDSTIIGEYPNNTPVQVSNVPVRKSGRFTWIQVVL